jgi:hypothetical protein
MHAHPIVPTASHGGGMHYRQCIVHCFASICVDALDCVNETYTLYSNAAYT